jgi:dTDP-4-dehydrorhamnose 3,5-epimerase
MNYKYLDFENRTDIIDGVILRKLIIHKDQTGSLVETLRGDWQDVFNESMPFKMQYMSITPPAVARDEDEWHVHKLQKDRFICISGQIVTAIFDARQESPTKGQLNLFKMGPENENEMYMIIIPEGTYHGFMVASSQNGHLLNFPTQIYNPTDEGRIKNTGQLSWQKVREDLGA